MKKVVIILLVVSLFVLAIPSVSLAATTLISNVKADSSAIYFDVNGSTSAPVIYAVYSYNGAAFPTNGNGLLPLKSGTVTSGVCLRFAVPKGTYYVTGKKTSLSPVETYKVIVK